MKGSTLPQSMALRTRQMPEPWVTRPQSTIRSAFWPGVMRCSHTPETTSPIAKPEMPEVSPPKNAAATSKVRPMLSMAHSRHGQASTRPSR